MTDGATNSPTALTQSDINGLNSRVGQANGILASYSPSGSPLSSTNSYGQTTPSNNKPQQHQLKDNVNTSIGSEDSESLSSPSSQLERSQSFKMSKKVQKTFAKGGSLRLSKKEASNLKEEKDNSKNEEADEDSDGESPKKMERKGSVLGRLFGRKKSNTSPKKEILTFSAQFPPPDLLENLKIAQRLQSSQSTETQTPPQVGLSNFTISRPEPEISHIM